MLNGIVIIGRLTRDPELRYTDSGTVITNFTLAVERDFKNMGTSEREVDVIKVTVWQRLAKNCDRYLKKGSMAAAEGQLYLNKDNGKEGRTYTDAFVIARNVRFLSFDNDSGGFGNDEDLEESIENKF